jgi:hypothetical protein
VHALKTDPSRTTGIRRRLMGRLAAVYRWLKGRINHLVVHEDSFGLKRRGYLNINANWQYLTDWRKLEEFNAWFKEQVDAGVLEVDPVHRNVPWLATHVHSAYRQGMFRAFMQALPAARAGNAAFYAGARAQFLHSAFNQPEVVDKIRLLYMRAFDQLVGVNADMAAQMSRILSQGLADGWSVRQIARELTGEIDKLSETRAMRIARTEIIHAHAEGQLDAFARLGLEEVGIMAEFITAGDGSVCAR